MLTSRRILWLCLVGSVISVGLRMIVANSAVQAVVDSCLASFIVTGLVTLRTYAHEFAENHKQTYFLLKRVYKEVVYIQYYVDILAGIDNSFFAGLSEAFNESLEFEDSVLRVKDEYRGVSTLREYVLSNERSFKNLAVFTRFVGESLLTMVDSFQAIKMLRRELDSEGRSDYLGPSSLIIDKVHSLVGMCTEIYNLYAYALCDEDTGYFFSNCAEYKAEFTPEIIESIRKDISTKLVEIDSSLLELGGSLRGILGGDDWRGEKAIIDLVNQSIVITQIKEFDVIDP